MLTHQETSAPWSVYDGRHPEQMHGDQMPDAECFLNIQQCERKSQLCGMTTARVAELQHACRFVTVFMTSWEPMSHNQRTLWMHG